ncbi:MAG: Rid family detoxifying hydrolase [Firmicutes bacterium]|nr:Rid family detoxifying hydrolase [Bacillota bacterium]
MKTVIATEKAPKAVGPYSQAIHDVGWTFVSGQLGINPATGTIDPDFSHQAMQAMQNLRAVVEAGGNNMSDIVKTTVFLTDIKEFPTFNKIYESFFYADYPARSCVQVAALPLGGKVEIEAIVALQSMTF